MMLNYYVLVCVLLATGGKQQSSLSEVGNATKPRLTPVVKIICDPTDDSSCHASSLEKIAKEAERFSSTYVNITTVLLQLNATVNFSQL